MSENCIKDSECTIDYKQAYARLIEENEKLLCENRELKNTIIGMCKKLFRKGHKDV